MTHTRILILIVMVAGLVSAAENADTTAAQAPSDSVSKPGKPAGKDLLDTLGKHEHIGLSKSTKADTVEQQKIQATLDTINSYLRALSKPVGRDRKK